MCPPQPRQRPRSHRYETSGRLSNQRSGVWQPGQCELGCTIDSSRGSRWITTFRNEPTHRPNTNAKPTQTPSGTAWTTSMSGDLSNDPPDGSSLAYGSLRARFARLLTQIAALEHRHRCEQHEREVARAVERRQHPV